MDSNVRPGKTIEEILDDAYCGTGKWELRLEKWESPRLDSRARAYRLQENKKDVITIDCADIRERYRKRFGISKSDKSDRPSNTRPLFERCQPAPIVPVDDDDDCWGEEWLDNDQAEEITPPYDAGYISPTAEEYNSFKLAIMSLIVRRFEVLDHARNKEK